MNDAFFLFGTEKFDHIFKKYERLQLTNSVSERVLCHLIDEILKSLLTLHSETILVTQTHAHTQSPLQAKPQHDILHSTCEKWFLF